MMAKERAMPQYHELMWPTLVAIRAAGGSATVEEIVDAIGEDMDLPKNVQEALHKEGPMTELGYRAAWARTYLKGMAFVENRARGVWAATPNGMQCTLDTLTNAFKKYRAEVSAKSASKRKAQATRKPIDPEEGDVDEGEAMDWQDTLLARVLLLKPDAFERLCQRLLRAEGFKSVEVTGRRGDAGIDLRGVYSPSLISFPVHVQCKRYGGNVGPDVVRELRGTIGAEKGILMTTGTLTKEARNEAVRPGLVPIDLVDGQRLCELLEKHQIGVHTKERTVRDVALDEDFFATL